MQPRVPTGLSGDTGDLELAIVIPAYYEHENLAELLPRIGANLDGWKSVSIAVVVERSCSDEDVQRLSELGARAVRRAPTDSFGDAMRTGLAAVPREANWVLVMDADGSHDPATIQRFREAALSGSADIVIASRYVAGGGSANQLPLYVMSRLLNRAYAVVLGIHARDLSTNYKLYRASVLTDIKLSCQNFDIVEEILAKARQADPGIVVKEIPDYFHQRRYGESKRRLGPFVASYLVTLARLRWETRSRQ